MKKIAKIKCNCLECNSEFETQRSWIKRGRGKFCSKICSAKFRTKNKDNFLQRGRIKSIESGEVVLGRKVTMVKIICAYCEKEFEIKKSKSRQKTCSLNCRKINIKNHLKKAYENVDKSKFSGENHYNWKGGEIPELKRIRDSPQYKSWRMSVFRRDHFTCQICGAKNSKENKVEIHADHIKSFSEHPDLRLSLDNGRTLCKPCHIKTDSWGKNTRLKNI